MVSDPDEILAFWREAGPKRWWAKDAAFDAEIRARYQGEHHAAARGELMAWTSAPTSCLALVILTDQFPRNLWRGDAHAYATDPIARIAARAAIDAGHDRAVEPVLKSFFYMPFMHSEDLADQDLGVALFDALEKETGDANPWARRHRDIVARFGRFPHRNACLARTTTRAEQAYLDEGGFSG